MGMRRRDFGMTPRSLTKYFAVLGLVLVLCMVQGLANPPVYSFSGLLQIKNGWNPYDEGTYPDPITDEGALVLHIQTHDTAAKIALNTADCHLLPIGCVDPRHEIPTEWRVWDSASDNDGKLELGELIDTGWLPVATFIETFHDSPIIVPSDWSGEIRFQASILQFVPPLPLYSSQPPTVEGNI